MIEQLTKPKTTYKRRYNCIDCQEPVHRQNRRCKDCAAILNRKMAYLTNYPAKRVSIEVIQRGIVLLTAQQEDLKETKIYYFEDIVFDVIRRLRTDDKLVAYTFDPQVYDSTQSGKAITINKQTIIIGA
jgi:hypothetical protein